MEDLSSKVELTLKTLPDKKEEARAAFAQTMSSYLKSIMEERINLFKDMAFLLLENIQLQVKSAVDKSANLCTGFTEVLLDMKYLVRASEMNELTTSLEDYDKIQMILKRLKNLKKIDEVITIKWHRYFNFVLENADNIQFIKAASWL
jgi:hypothetical protein